MTRSLPAQPNLEHLKKQAKRLRKSHQQENPSVCAVLRHLQRFVNATQEEILRANITLADVQYALAQDYGFSSWDALKARVEGCDRGPKLLHVHCGDYSAEALRRSGVPGTVIVWQDPLMSGPTPAGLTAREWVQVRARNLDDWFETEAEAIQALENMDRRLEEYPDYDEVVLWFDACLYDQTILIRQLDWFSRHNLGKTVLSLICMGEFPGLSKFSGLGELSPEQMATLLPTRHPVTPAETRLAVNAWQVYRAPDPTAVTALLAGNTTALPFLGDALLRHLQRFPSTLNGLSRLEQEALEVIAGGDSKFSQVFKRVSDREERPFFGVETLYSSLEDLAADPHPLVIITGMEAMTSRTRRNYPYDQSAFQITPTGREVIAGSQDWIDLHGIDRWLGGVHLQGAEAAWRWDFEQERLVHFEG
ncbi:MAG: DUF1835 domain-containing protein [Armatimonadota bacterium]